MNKNFLLKNKTAQKLYNNYAAHMPIIDYHCHVDPKEIYKNCRFDNLTQLWLGGDHYKWRIMRSNGVDEKYITGNASDYNKFLKFVQALSKCVGNPMYHWCHLELKKYFGYDGYLTVDTAKEVWELTIKKLQTDENLSVRGIINQSNVHTIGTTDDPIYDLKWHKKIAKDKSFKTDVIPTFRPDKALNIEKDGWLDYVKNLGAVYKIEIKTFDDLKKVLKLSLAHFVKFGCKASDHGLDYIPFTKLTSKSIDTIFEDTFLKSEKLSSKEVDAYKTELLIYLAKLYAKNDIVMQLHYGAIRNTNSKMFNKLGADTGFDCINDTSCTENLVKLLDELDECNKLPKTILYSLNPNDNAILGTVLGCFQSNEVAGKIQHGSAWWFNDTKIGMEDQIKSLANLGILGNFIGMLTDSRSFLSYTRHEYFRRILCNIIGEWIENGEYCNDLDSAGKLIQDICFNNSNCYFFSKDNVI